MIGFKNVTSIILLPQHEKNHNSINLNHKTLNPQFNCPQSTGHTIPPSGHCYQPTFVLNKIKKKTTSLINILVY